MTLSIFLRDIRSESQFINEQVSVIVSVIVSESEVASELEY